MKRAHAVALILSLAIPAVSCGSSKPRRCKEGFATFLENDWESYCASYKTHIESPTKFTLQDLAKFFGEHPSKIKALNENLYQHQDYEACFVTKREELELRALQSCIAGGDKQDLEILNAWNVASEPWLEDASLDIGELKPKVIEAEQEAIRLGKKVSDAIDAKRKVEEGTFEPFDAQVAEIEKQFSRLGAVEETFKKLEKAAAPNKALSTTLTKEVEPKINAMSADIADLRRRTEALKQVHRYLDFASSAVGVPCPSSKKGASKEEKIAKDIVGGKVGEVRGSAVRVSSEISRDNKGGVDYERFTGFICGVRSTQNQFEGLSQLCGQYQFVIERSKSGDSWGSWTLKTFEESGPSGGVDCSMLSGPPVKKRPPKPKDPVF